MAGSLFSSAFGGGLGVGSSLADIFFEGKNRRKLGQLEQLFRSGDYNNAGAMLAGMGQVGQGVNTLNIPYERQRQEQQQQFNNQQAEALMRFRMQPDIPSGYVPVDPNNPAAGVKLLPGYDPTVGGPPETWNNPQEELDETGKPVVVQYSNRGQRRIIDGASPAGSLQKTETGTETILTNRYTGEVVSRTPTQNYQQSYDTKSGALAADSVNENRSELSSMQSKMGGLRDVVKELEVLADKATFTKAGQIYDEGLRQMGRDPTQGGIARTEYIAKVDNQVLPLLRDTFGAAFTVKEGETLRATLGDPNKSPAEKKAVLKAFIDQKERNVLAAASKNLGTVSPLTPTNGPRETINVPSPQNAGKTRESAVPVSSEQEAESLPVGSYFILNGRVGRIK